MNQTLARLAGCVVLWACTFSVSASLAQPPMSIGSGPRLISYQGFMMDKDQRPVNGTHTIAINYYSETSGGNLAGGETFRNVVFTMGVFEVVLGGGFVPPQFPASMTFAEPVWIEFTLDPGAPTEQVFPRVELSAVPYALNSERVNGLQVFDHPINGALWPLPLDASGRIDTSILPIPQRSVQTINNIASDAGGNLALTANGSVGLFPDPSTHSIMISSPPAGMVPVGTTAQRPATSAQGMIRFNTDTNKFEAFDGSVWHNLN
ncbi:MAG: hypothetical protein Q8922_04795 [Bacteroidota bacterium]|nr:hypothetical protein [Bacteroidota bacterium]MDP4231977.1 hypothetical protein [Bacteroidota bacterium]MDP4241316.1 hypothetical protein [Bacteroidota bacterium]MDP4287237.1 hypothetical protein [Bacteroidota bacterium]